MIKKAKLEIDYLLAIELIKARTLFRNFHCPSFTLTLSNVAHRIARKLSRIFCDSPIYVKLF